MTPFSFMITEVSIHWHKTWQLVCSVQCTFVKVHPRLKVGGCYIKKGKENLTKSLYFTYL